MPEVQTFRFEDDGVVPNNPRFPLLVYADAFAAGVSAAQIQDRFQASGWQGAWVNGVFGYQHFHSAAHEVLGCFSGRATVQFGGEAGPKIEISAGAGVVIPAGVGHKSLAASADFRVVGAYPPGQEVDLCQGDEDDRARVIEAIARVAKPSTDPFFGESGPLIEHWK